jgi:hypothetical protein
MPLISIPQVTFVAVAILYPGLAPCLLGYASSRRNAIPVPPLSSAMK